MDYECLPRCISGSVLTIQFLEQRIEESLNILQVVKHHMVPEKELPDKTLEIMCPRVASAIRHCDQGALLAIVIV